MLNNNLKMRQDYLSCLQVLLISKYNKPIQKNLNRMNKLNNNSLIKLFNLKVLVKVVAITIIMQIMKLTVKLNSHLE